MNKFLIIVLIISWSFVGLNNFAFAADKEAASAVTRAIGDLESSAGKAGMQEGDVVSTVGKLIGVVLSILGLIFLILIIYAGITWITKASESKEVQKARKIITDGVVGMLICLAAYALTQYIIGKLTG